MLFGPDFLFSDFLSDSEIFIHARAKAIVQPCIKKPHYYGGGVYILGKDQIVKSDIYSLEKTYFTSFVRNVF